MQPIPPHGNVFQFHFQPGKRLTALRICGGKGSVIRFQSYPALVSVDSDDFRWVVEDSFRKKWNYDQACLAASQLEATAVPAAFPIISQNQDVCLTVLLTLNGCDIEDSFAPSDIFPGDVGDHRWTSLATWRLPLELHIPADADRSTKLSWSAEYESPLMADIGERVKRSRQQAYRQQRPQQWPQQADAANTAALS